MNLLFRSSKGQALIETLVVTTVTILATYFVLMFVYRGILYVGARHNLNELLYCEASVGSGKHCEIEFQRRMKAFLIFGEKAELKIFKNSLAIRARFQIKGYGAPLLRLERKLHLPFQRNL